MLSGYVSNLIYFILRGGALDMGICFHFRFIFLVWYQKLCIYFGFVALTFLFFHFPFGNANTHFVGFRSDWASDFSVSS